MAAVERRTRNHAQFRQRRQLKQQLHKTGGEHAPGQRHQRLFEQRRGPVGGGDQAQVEQHRGESRHRELVETVENAAGKRHQRNKKQIGKGDAQHLGGQVKTLRFVDKAGGKHRHQQRRRQRPDDGDAQQNAAQPPGDMIDQVFQLIRPLFLVFGKHRHKGLRKRPLGEQPAHEIGDFERHQKGVGAAGGAEQRRQRDIAQQPEHARQQGHAAHRNGG